MNEIIDRDLMIVLPQPSDALTVFTKPGGIQPFLDMVRAKIDAFEGDATTEAGRKQIKSFAHKITKSKTALEEVGKALAAEQKEIPKKIDAARRLLKETLDRWHEEVRQPVTEWESAEEDRVNRIKADLAELERTINDPEWMGRSAECLRDRLAEIERQEITEAAFNEYLEAAEELKAKAVATLTDHVRIAEKREADQAELAALRAKEAAREAEERAEQLRKEGEERARLEAEADARAEKERAERKLADEKAAAEKRERELIAEKEAAERRAAETAARIKKEFEDKKRAEEAETARREADKAHKRKVNNAALAALIENGIDDASAKEVIKLIASKAIPSVTIHY